MTWDPSQYLAFDDLRTRPALDLLGRIPDITPEVVWDLGCGTGHITRAIAARWPAASVHGLDSSEEMLDRARSHSDVTWVLGDIAEWTPDQPIDVVFSNAALHWLGDHERLLPNLLEALRPGGILAVQMPRNHTEPSHQILYQTARSDRWKERLAHIISESPVAAPETYHALLSPISRRLEVWETIYQQELTGVDPVAQWTKGSVLRPYLDALGDDADGFFSEYAAALRPHYPSRSDGTTLFPFRRVFIVAVR